MKQFIWMLCGIFLSGLLLGTLSACGADQFSTCVIITEKASPAPKAAPAPAEQPEDPPAPQDAPKPGTSITAEEDEARRLAYGKALWDMYLLGLLPGGEELGRATELGPQEGNEFALCDVNGDGAEELVVYWTTVCVAGMRGLVYGYGDGELQMELSEFPALTFYDNGTLRADWSHNQGWAMDFWPHTLYRYEPEAGTYAEAGAVDAWDSRRNPGAFPKDVDADGDGLVYFLLSGNRNWGRITVPEGGTYETWTVPPVDGAAYEAWRDSLLGGAEEIEPAFQPLTEANISALGYPKPDVTYPEPVG